MMATWCLAWILFYDQSQEEEIFFSIVSPKGLELISIDRETFEANKLIKSVKLMSGYQYRQLGLISTRDL